MKFIKSFILVTFSFFCMITPAFASVPGVDKSMGRGATKGIVSVSHPLAAEAGIKILKQGGNAVDAAAAIQLSLNVVEPMMSGIGGGGFIMIYNKKENKITMIDSREMAPQNVTPELFLDEKGKPIPFSKRHTSGKAVAVPGTLMGVETALEKYGTLDISQVIDPAIKQAEKGVKVNWITAQYIDENVKKLQNNQAAANVFVPNGQPLKEGDTLVQPDLAKTLKLIKKQGSEVFYSGQIGKALTKEVQKREGTMTTEDLENYVVKEREPIRSEYRGYELAGAASPSSGSLTVQQILELMEGFDVQKMGANSPEYLHYLTEAMHLAFADRAAYMADEDFYDVPTKGLLDEDYIKERRKLINPNRSTADVKEGDPWKYEGTEPTSMEKVKEEKTPIGQTTHFSVMDKWGNMVAYTTTIEQVFGSGIMVPDYGFMLNNEMTDFDATPGGVNQVEPRKRPRSSMSPTFVLKDGQPFMAIGSPGGATIISSVSETIMNVIDHHMSIQEAILMPRIYSASYPTVRWEPGIEQNTRLELMAKGHVYEEQPQHIGNVQAVIFDYEHGKMYGGADNTRQGTVLGVDRISYKSKPIEIREEKKGPFTLKVNGAVYPYTANQMKIINGKPYIQSDKLLLGLGVIGTADLKTYKPDKKSYLPVIKVAKSLGYKVEWDEKDKVVLLEKDKTDVEDPDDDGTITN